MADSVHQCDPASEPVKPGPDPSSSPFPSLHSEATGPATKKTLIEKLEHGALEVAAAAEETAGAVVTTLADALLAEHV